MPDARYNSESATLSRAQQGAPTASLLTPGDKAVCVNIGSRLGRGQIDATTALRWLQGWVHTSSAIRAGL